jgi:hypothetical protein
MAGSTVLTSLAYRGRGFNPIETQVRSIGPPVEGSPSLFEDRHPLFEVLDVGLDIFNPVHQSGNERVSHWGHQLCE